MSRQRLSRGGLGAAIALTAIFTAAGGAMAETLDCVFGPAFDALVYDGSWQRGSKESSLRITYVLDRASNSATRALDGEAASPALLVLAEPVLQLLWTLKLSYPPSALTELTTIQSQGASRIAAIARHANGPGAEGSRGILAMQAPGTCTARE